MRKPDENRVGFQPGSSCEEVPVAISREEMAATEKTNGHAKKRAAPAARLEWLRPLLLPAAIIIAGWMVASAVNNLTAIVQVKEMFPRPPK